MPKRRTLNRGQQVLILYHKHMGFVEIPAEFIEYRPIRINEINHSTPFFKYDNKEISGLECFWILPHEINNASMRRLQYDIIQLQLRVLELANRLEYKMPIKVNDPQIRDAASSLVQKLGYDPRDESWLETDMAANDRERNWFRFERENTVSFYHLLYSSDWENIVRLFNEQFRDTLLVPDAKELSLKRMRYVMGSTAIRLGGNADRSQWKQLASEFNDFHAAVDARMNNWSRSRNGKFPVVKVKKDIPFNPGPYFNECLERIPNYFTTAECRYVRTGSLLRVVSYDPEQKYIRLDFPEEIRKTLKPDERSSTPWISEGGDYLIFVTRQDTKDALEFLDGFQP